MTSADRTERTIKSVDQAIQLIKHVGEAGGATLSEIADACEFSKSTAHHYKETLMRHGYLVREGDTYHVGLRLLDPAIRARERRTEFDMIKPKVTELAEETGERAHFIVEENGLGIKVYNHVGEQGIETGARVGKTVHLHVSAAGKSILSCKEPAEVDAIIDQHGLPKFTEATITTREELCAELEETRERGYAFIRGERRSGLHTIGAPVTTSNGEILGALSVTGPVRRMENTHEAYLPDLLLDLTEEIQIRLDYADT
jgi:DNA-binding IclR family transcriptional regulator